MNRVKRKIIDPSIYAIQFEGGNMEDINDFIEELKLGDICAVISKIDSNEIVLCEVGTGKEFYMSDGSWLVHEIDSDRVLIRTPESFEKEFEIINN